MKICGPLRLIRKFYSNSRLCIALSVFAVLSLSYSFSPKLFKLPPTHIGWRDDDFHQISEKGKGESLDKEIIILRWTANFRGYRTAKILNSKKCAMLEAGNAEQKTSSVFNVSCRISFDRRYLKGSDALVFHSYDLMWEELPQDPRNLNQLWVYLQQESPRYTKANLQAYPNIFNWTMTYRRDSDVYIPYSQLVPMSSNHRFNESDFLSKLTNKTDQVAWILSNCRPPSKREYFVEELKKYINIDTFGWCGRKCPPKRKQHCYDYVSKRHKFFLAFENALCSEYVTEKFFNALKYNMIPVVYGGIGGQDYSSVAPNYSYIDARYFKSPKDLANYLIYLDRNDEEYLKYFEWKDKYSFVSDDQCWCSLCQRVHEHLMKDSPDRKWYGDLWKWWNFVGNDTPACLEPTKKFTDFNHGYFKVGISGHVTNWVQKTFF